MEKKKPQPVVASCGGVRLPSQSKKTNTAFSTRVVGVNSNLGEDLELGSWSARVDRDCDRDWKPWKIEALELANEYAAHDNTDARNATAKALSGLLQPFSDLTRHEGLTGRLVESAEVAKARKFVERFRRCGSWMEYQHRLYDKKNGWELTAINRCDIHQLCPTCAHYRTVENLRNYGDIVEVGAKVYEPRCLTLTRENVSSEDLRAACKDLHESFNTLWKQRRMGRGGVLRNVEGAIVSLEITFNEDRGDWHPHLHVLLFCNPYRAEWPRWFSEKNQRFESHPVDVRELRSTWEDLDQGRIMRIDPVNEGTIKEVLKYPLKFWGRSKRQPDGSVKVEGVVPIPQRVQAYRICFRLRFLRSYGMCEGKFRAKAVGARADLFRYMLERLELEKDKGELKLVLDDLQLVRRGRGYVPSGEERSRTLSRMVSGANRHLNWAMGQVDKDLRADRLLRRKWDWERSKVAPLEAVEVSPPSIE